MHSHAYSDRWSGPFDPRALWLAMSGGRGGPGYGHGGHGRGRGRGRGRPPFGPPFGPGFGRGSRARRGDVRAALLVLLAEEPRNGYGLMQEIESRSGGAWRPSPGSVYPALQQLEDEALVRPDESGGRKLFTLTDEGRAYVTANEAELGQPWDAVNAESGGEDFAKLRGHVFGIGGAVMSILQDGNEAQVAEATKILAETRRSLYRILAGDETDEA